jgi:hypothetical protein
VRYSRTGSQTPVWVTAQALTALARRSFPINPPQARRAATVSSISPARAAPAPPRPRPRAHGAGLMARALSALLSALRSSAQRLALSAAL